MDFCGWVPMHYAVYRGQVEAATALVLRDANIIARSLIYHHFASALPPGCSPLHIAASQGNLPMIQLILRAYVSLPGGGRNACSSSLGEPWGAWGFEASEETCLRGRRGFEGPGWVAGLGWGRSSTLGQSACLSYRVQI